MTTDKRTKKAARDRQNATGERYTTAQRHVAAPAAHRFETDHCANCFEQLYEGIEGLFCTERCSQTAKFVRYSRATASDGRIDDPDVQLALRTRLAHILGDGYHQAARKLPDALRRQLWIRDRSTCVQCGGPGTEIDHIDGDSSDLANLQLLCPACHHAKTAERMKPVNAEQMAWIRDLKRRRVRPVVPALLADDGIRWPAEWRALKKERRTRLLADLSDLGYARRDFPGVSWLDMWDEVLGADEGDEGGWTEDDDSGFGPYSYFAHAMAKDD